MGGGNVAYNLRPNKFVERQLFVELLQLLCFNNSPDKYAYISLGGPQLEDQKLIHHYLRFRTLVSLESDPVIVQRQQFNLRPSFVECRHQSTSDFVATFDLFTDRFKDKVFVIWFDYATPRDRLTQLIEYETLLSKLQGGDILKLTLNANALTLGEKNKGESEETVLRRRLDRLRDELHRYLPESNLTHSDMTNRSFPFILCEAIKQASLKAVQVNGDLQPVPLSVFCYQDGPHQMLTLTVCLQPEGQLEVFRQKLMQQQWEFLPSNWQDITRINVPNLTAKERLYLEQILFSDSDENIHGQLPFRFDANESQSLRILKAYAQHYRRYPSYFQVVL